MSETYELVPFAKTYGKSVKEVNLLHAAIGCSSVGPLVDIEVTRAECCTFVTLKSEGNVQHIALGDDGASVLGHALTTAVRR